jgi:hypothetical protein
VKKIDIEIEAQKLFIKAMRIRGTLSKYCKGDCEDCSACCDEDCDECKFDSCINDEMGNCIDCELDIESIDTECGSGASISCSDFDLDFYINQLPGCCAYGIISDYHLNSPKGFIKEEPEWVCDLVKFLEKCIKVAGFPFAMIQTVKIGNHDTIYDKSLNEVLMKALKVRKWEAAHSGKNYKSSNTVTTWIKKVMN